MPPAPNGRQESHFDNGKDSKPEVPVRARLYQKIAKVYEAVNYIQKDKRNTFHGYSYASEAAIKAALHEAFVANGLILLPPSIDEVRDEAREEKDRNGNSKITLVTTIKVRFAIADVETGEQVEGVLSGRGVDPLDKGIYKAITGALKYYLTTTFLIPTGDDPEAEEPRPEKPEPRASRPKPPRTATMPAQATDPAPAPPAPARAAAPASGDRGSAPAPKPAGPDRAAWFAAGRSERLQSFRDLERLLPPDDFYKILEAHGVEMPDQFKSGNTAWACYEQLWRAAQEYRARQSDPTTYEHHLAQEGWVA
jgi:hypothetical protein